MNKITRKGAYLNAPLLLTRGYCKHIKRKKSSHRAALPNGKSRLPSRKHTVHTRQPAFCHRRASLRLLFIFLYCPDRCQFAEESVTMSLLVTLTFITLDLSKSSSSVGKKPTVNSLTSLPTRKPPTSPLNCPFAGTVNGLDT